ncbi:MAG TPA: hypothetical protein VMF91_07990 [Bryobacteraceae bacterium]|nr:hypothetical protein [Bryobacteraceae bacterium]
MHFETALNVAWLLLGLVALACTAHAAFRQKREQGRAPAWLHIVGVGLIVAALFPYISATDDILRIEHFSAQQDSHRQRNQTKIDDLIRLYEVMDSPLACRVSQVTLTFFFFSLVFAPFATLIERIAPFEAGRSPPLPPA